mgnify:CR=1 FL=1
MILTMRIVLNIDWVTGFAPEVVNLGISHTLRSSWRNFRSTRRPRVQLSPGTGAPLEPSLANNSTRTRYRSWELNRLVTFASFFGVLIVSQLLSGLALAEADESKSKEAVAVEAEFQDEVESRDAVVVTGSRKEERASESAIRTARKRIGRDTKRRKRFEFLLFASTINIQMMENK